MKHVIFPLATLLVQPVSAAVVGPVSGAVAGVQPASVLEVNPAGVGHVNLVPYFSVRSGFDTYLNLTNTDTRNGKAVKLRFRSAAGGEDVGSFTLLLGPGDVWAAAVTRDAATGYARVVHGDHSCTLPANVQVSLGPAYLPTSGGTQTEDATLTQDGSVEIITMADIPALTPGGQASALYAAVTAAGVLTGPSCDTTALSPLAVDSSSYADARSKGLDVPSSGLQTQWTLINVPRAVSYSGRATAVEARVAAGGAPGYGNVVLFPQTATYVADAARTIAYTTNPSIRGWAASNPDGVSTNTTPTSGYVEHQMPDLSTPYLPSGLSAALSSGTAARLQAYAINKALAAASISGEFATEPSILAKTDWIVTLPTRYLQVGYFAGSMGSLPFPTVTNLSVDEAGNPIAGVKNFFQYPGNLGSSWSNWPVCVTGMDPYTSNASTTPPPQADTGFRTREGVSMTLQPQTWDNGSPLPLEFCGSSLVLRFARPGDAATAPGAIGEARNRRQLISPQTAGWGRIRIPGVSNQGLPIIGFAAVELYNGAVTPGIAGVFGQTFPLGNTRP